MADGRPAGHRLSVALAGFERLLPCPAPLCRASRGAHPQKRGVAWPPATRTRTRPPDFATLECMGYPAVTTGREHEFLTAGQASSRISAGLESHGLPMTTTGVSHLPSERVLLWIENNHDP